MAVTAISIAEPHFPYLIKEEGSKSTSFISIELPRNAVGMGEESQLFYIAGAEISTRTSSAALPETRIQLQHSFGRDDEADISYYAIFTLKALTPSNYNSHGIIFGAILTQVQFYAIPAADPFRGAVRKGPDHDPYANSGYPYLPPTVDFPAHLQLPFEVEVNLYYNMPEADAYLQETMHRIGADRVERAQAKAEKEREQRAAQAKRRAEDIAYFQTEEGKDDKAVTTITRLIRTLPRGEGDWHEAEFEETRAKARSDYAALDTDVRERVRRLAAGNELDIIVDSRNPMRMTYWDELRPLLN